MYAAAGGASIASRQARQKQKLKKAGQKAAATASAAGKPLTGPKLPPKVALPPQSKPFHNLPSNYYNQSNQFGVKPKSTHHHASGGTQGGLKPPQHPHTHRRNSSNVHLQTSETVGSHLSRARSSAKIHHSQSCMFAKEMAASRADAGGHHLLQPLTPAALAATGGSQLIAPPRSPRGSTLFLGPEDGPRPLERRCSVGLRDAADEATTDYDYDNQNQLNQMAYDEERPRWNIHDDYDKYDCSSLDFPFSECSQGRAAWQERERERRGSLTEAALNHRTRQTEAHLRWMKRNRIHDSSYGGSSDEEDILGGLYGHQSAAANALLYVGLGTVAIGAVIFFVGTGEKGFKTLELRLIGPSLVGCGFLCCLVRILLCVCPSRCFRRRKRKRCRHGAGATGAGGESDSRRYRNIPPGAGVVASEDFRMADHNTSLLRKQTTNGQRNNSKKRVSIATGCSKSGPSTSTQSYTNNYHNIATTSLFLQNEQENSLVPKLIPTIGIPHLIEVSDVSEFNKARDDDVDLPRAESIIELQNFDHDYDDDDDDEDEDDDDDDDDDDDGHVDDNNREDETSDGGLHHDQTSISSEDAVPPLHTTKIHRKREPLNASSSKINNCMETSLTITPPTNNFNTNTNNNTTNTNKNNNNNNKNNTINNCNNGLLVPSTLAEVTTTVVERPPPVSVSVSVPPPPSQRLHSGELVLSPSKLGQ